MGSYGAEISQQISAVVVLEESRDSSSSAAEYKRLTLAQFLCSLFCSHCSFYCCLVSHCNGHSINDIGRSAGHQVSQSAILVYLSIGHLIRQSVTWSANQLIIISRLVDHVISGQAGQCVIDRVYSIVF